MKQQNTQTPSDTCRHAAQMCVFCSCDRSRLNRAGPVTASVLEELFSFDLIMELWATGQRKQMPEQEVVGSLFKSSLIFFLLATQAATCHHGMVTVILRGRSMFFLLNQLCLSVSAQSDPSLSWYWSSQGMRTFSNKGYSKDRLRSASFQYTSCCSVNL